MPAHAAVYPEPPKISHSIAELGRIFWEAGSNAMLRPLYKFLPSGDGHSVMTLPGFFGADGSMASIRKFLDKQGYVGVPWGLGRNMPAEGVRDMESMLLYRRQMEETLAEKLQLEKQRTGGKVSLIGWSLGGLYATGLAHRYPDLVRQVVTLGTPFGDPRGTSLYAPMQRAIAAEVAIEMIDEWIDFTFDGDLQVPVTALYSLSDGFVGAGIAQLPEHDLMESVAVMASHVGFPFNPLVRFVLAERLAQREGHWRAYDKLNLKPFIHSPG
jgi:pimeloyl-ACP methyl ester carboxylesterase